MLRSNFTSNHDRGFNSSTTSGRLSSPTFNDKGQSPFGSTFGSRPNSRPSSSSENGYYSRSPRSPDSGKSAFARCLEWINYQKSLCGKSSYGRCPEDVRQNMAEATLRMNNVREFRGELDRGSSKMTAEESRLVSESYNELVAVVEKKLECLKTLEQVVSMERNIGQFSRELDLSCASLSEPEFEPTSVNLPGFLSPGSLDCVFAVRDGWERLIGLLDCAKTHLRNGANHHQFFHEVEENRCWFERDLDRICRQLSADDDKSGADALQMQFEDMRICLRQWESKVNQLCNAASNVVPIHTRTRGVMEPTPARCLTDCHIGQIVVREGEDLLLVDNSKPDKWKVRTARGDEVELPAVVVLIPGPDKEAAETASRMRLQLMNGWSNSIKRIGQKLMCRMLTAIKPDYSDNEIEALRSADSLDKQELLRTLNQLEQSLRAHWSHTHAFMALQERLLALRMIVEEAGERPLEDESVMRALLEELHGVESLSRGYDSLCQDWAGFRMTTDSGQISHQPLLPEGTKQVKYVNKGSVSKMLTAELPVSASDLAILNSGKPQQFAHVHETDNVFAYGDDVISSSVRSFLESSNPDVLPSSEIRRLSDSPLKRGTTSQSGSLSRQGSGSGSGSGSHASGSARSSVSPVKARSAILSTGHIGQHDVTEETIEEAVDGYGGYVTRGRVSSSEGTSFGYATETKTAETEQLVSTELEESKRFTIRWVRDPRDGSKISLEQAIVSQIIDSNNGKYVNPDNGEWMHISEAMSKELIRVEFTTTKRGTEKKSTIGIITVKTIREPHRPYVIKTVKDTELLIRVSRKEAAQRGLIDEALGTFRDKMKGKNLLMMEAIQQGHVEVEYTGPPPEVEVVANTYAVRAVVDRLQKKTVTFAEAVRRGIIDKEDGSFRDTASGHRMYVGDAIARGFLKARRISDTSTLNIDPDNSMLIDKTNLIRKKIIRPLGVISAFKKAAEGID